MAVELATAYISLVPSAKGIGQNIAREVGAPAAAAGKKAGEDLGKQMSKGAAPGIGSIATAIGGVAAVKGAFDFLGGAVGDASDLNETVSKARTIFGPAAADLEKWASNAATAFGQSKQQALDAAGSFGNLFVQLGVGSDQARAMSQSMVELASDFASFHNADVSQVLEAQTAAFRGEYDALQRFVPTINAAAVEQEALAATGKKSTKELTLQEKALAVQALMLKGAGDAAGDFARTSDGLANKQRIQAAQWADLRAKIGNGLLPVITKLTSFVAGSLVPAISKMAKWIGENKALVAPLAVIIGGALVAAFVSWAASAGAAAAATIAATAPILAIGAAIAALVAGIIWAYQNWDFFRESVDKAWQAIQVAWDWVQKITSAVFDFGRKVVGFLLDYHPLGIIFSNLPTILGAVRDAFQWVIDKVAALIGWVKKLPGQIDKALGPLDEIIGKAGSVGGGLLNAIPGGGLVRGIAGFFDDGGTVPGPIGRPQLVVAHGGETVLPTHKSGAFGGVKIEQNFTTPFDPETAYALASRRAGRVLSRAGLR